MSPHWSDDALKPCAKIRLNILRGAIRVKGEKIVMRGMIGEIWRSSLERYLSDYYIARIITLLSSKRAPLT